MNILGIESSCDETSASIVQDGRKVLSCVIASSGKDFEKRGGVIPEDAARKQLESILPVVEKSLRDASLEPSDIDAIAVTYGPGLLGSLLVGTTTARTLSLVWGKPIIPVHHTLGHLSSTWLLNADDAQRATAVDDPQFPVLTLSVSGGHTDLWYRTAHTRGQLIGHTIDDAAGEAFDKGAVLLGLPYPGGPALSALAETGDRTTYEFPHPLRHAPFSFSFSGLKTSLKYLKRNLESTHEWNDTVRRNVASSYESAIVDHLVSRLEHALTAYPGTKELHCVGGVSANRVLRERCHDLGKKNATRVRFPETLRFCTDNAGMIASAGYFLQRESPTIVGSSFRTSGSLSLQSVTKED